MITDIDLWVDSNEREFLLKGYSQVTYGYPREYYKISHYTDELLAQLQWPTLKLWHLVMSRLHSSTDKVKCVSIEMRYPQFQDQFKRNSYYIGLKELVRYRLLLETSKPFVYVVNIQHAHKLNSPKSYPHRIVVPTNSVSRDTTVNAEIDNDTRPLAF